MKKILFAALVACFAINASAQDKWYGSREGGFALSFNANPVLKYAGNMFNGTVNNTFDDFEGMKDGLFNGTTITGKYFLMDNIAINAGFGFNNTYNVNNAFADPDAKDPAKETSFTRNSNTEFMFKIGGEYRLRAGERLQPLFGADLVYVHGNNWNYQEQEVEDKTTPAVGDGASGNYTYAGNPTEKIGIMLNAGIEYFIIPQISVGANVNLGLAKTINKNSVDNKPEGDDLLKNYTKTNTTRTELKTNKGAFGAAGNISLNFYF